ncbi:MAG: hypothetical protein JXR96_14765 [Deltaproteobacteria bacterium]|nr:hypothetical protein [Deltaproteobacteria bacterium]
MMRVLCISLALFTLVLLTACGSGDGGSGACEQSNSPYYWCHNFHDDSEETGEEICDRLGGSWTAGSSCQDLGYTVSCSDGSYVKPSGSCL